MPLRFFLSNAEVSVTIKGMRKLGNIVANIFAGDGKVLPDRPQKELNQICWDKVTNGMVIVIYIANRFIKYSQTIQG